MDPSRESIGNCEWFLSLHMEVLRRHFFLPNMQFWVLYDSSGHSRKKFRHLCSPAWIHCLGYSSERPAQDQVAVRVCLCSPTQLFSAFSFDPRAWTMVVFWKETLWRQPQIITPEHEGGDETNYPLRQPSLMIPDVPCGPGGPPGSPEPPGPPGPAPGWPPDPSPAGERVRVGPRKNSRERVPLRPSQPEPQLVPIPMSAWRWWSATTGREVTVTV